MSQFRSVAVAERECLRDRTGLYLLDSNNVNSLTSPALHFECLLETSATCFCLQKCIKN